MAFDQAIADTICERVAAGQTLSETCRELKIGRRTFHDWREKDAHLAAQFARAKDAGHDAIADEILSIADDARNDWMERHGKDGESIGWEINGEHVQRSRLRVEARLKLLAKWDPKRYGDRIQSDVDLSVTVTVVNPFQIAPETLQAVLEPLPALSKPEDV